MVTSNLVQITVTDVPKTLNRMLNQIENKAENILILVGIEGDIEGKNWFYVDHSHDSWEKFSLLTNMLW